MLRNLGEKMGNKNFTTRAVSHVSVGRIKNIFENKFQAFYQKNLNNLIMAGRHHMCVHVGTALNLFFVNVRLAIC